MLEIGWLAHLSIWSQLLLVVIEGSPGGLSDINSRLGSGLRLRFEVTFSLRLHRIRIRQRQLVSWGHFSGTGSSTSPSPQLRLCLSSLPLWEPEWGSVTSGGSPSHGPETPLD